jgi:hypothetical protein
LFSQDKTSKFCQDKTSKFCSPKTKHPNFDLPRQNIQFKALNHDKNKVHLMQINLESWVGSGG